MSALALLIAALVSQGDLAPTTRAEARVRATLGSVEVGEPFTLELVVLHDADDVPAVDAAALDSDPSWAVLGGGELTTLPDPRRPQLQRTGAQWSVVSLEAGTRELPAPAVALPGSDAGPVALEVERGSLEVAAVLAPGEDEPRPLGAFLGLGPEPPRSAWQTAASWLAALLLLASAVLVAQLARRRSKQPAVAVPTGLKRLEALGEAELADAEAIRSAHIELVGALRRHIEQASGLSFGGLTDEEWTRRLASRLGEERAREFGELFAACEPVRYGGEVPTHWATRERIAQARELAAAVSRLRFPVEAAA